MKEKWLKLKDSWSQLASREKQMVVIGSIALGLFMIYQFILSPLINGSMALRERIVMQEKTLQWMQAADKKLKALHHEEVAKNKTTSLVALLGILQKNIDQNGLGQSLKQLKQGHNERIEVKFEKVAFDKAIPLLIDFSKEESVTIPQLSVLPHNKPGLVDIEVIIRPEA